MSDLRTKRTRANIQSAFLALRAKKPLEKITVKELAELAHINKATFYLHYRDIYDLSDQVEDEILEESLRSLCLNESALNDPAQFVRALIDACEPHIEAIETVFSGGREAILPDKIEAGIKAHFYRANPRMAEDLHTEVLLSYMIQGSYRAYVKHEQHGALEVLSMVAEISHTLAQSYQPHPPAAEAAEPVK
ncbi:MAG: TetR/AcrR family transcriptional regulator [Oscillospiraceae bacterium]